MAVAKKQTKKPSVKTMAKAPVMEGKNIPQPAESTTSENAQIKELMEQERRLLTAKKFLKYCVDGRRRYDYEWMQRDLFRRGYQFSGWSPTTQTVQISSRQTAKLPINLMNAQMRSICNQVTSFRPKWEVTNVQQNEASKTNARYSQLFLDNFYETERLKTKIKETVKQGLMYSVGGPWQVVFDPKTERVKIWLCDTFDFYFDPLAEDLEESEGVVKCVRRPVDFVRKNPEFNSVARAEISGTDNKIAVSEYKQFMIQAIKQVTQIQIPETETIMVYEGYFKERDENGDVQLRKVVWTDQNTIPLIDELQDPDENEYDFIIYRADINPKEILGESWAKHVMPINKAMNVLESQTFEYNMRVAKGRIVVDRDSGVRAIHDVHGEIIEKTRGAEVRALDMPSLPVAVTAQIERLRRYQEDIGGVHDASLGRLPTGIRSGIGVAELKQSDTTNQNDLVENLEDFLEDVAKVIFRKIRKYYKKPQLIEVLGHRETEAKSFAVIGDTAKRNGSKVPGHENQIKVGPDWVDLAVIGKEANVRVNIGSWLGYTKEAMEQKVLQFQQAGLIDQKTALSLLEFGNIDEIIQNTRKEKLINKALNKELQPGDVDNFALAQEENTMMVQEGKNMPVMPQDDHFVHISVHQEALGLGADELVMLHIQKHQVYADESWGSEMPTEQPQQAPGAMQGPEIGSQMGMGGMMPGMPPMGGNMAPPPAPVLGGAPPMGAPMGAPPAPPAPSGPMMG